MQKSSRNQIRDQIEKEKGKALAPLMNKYLGDQGQGKWDCAAYTKARGSPVAKEFEEPSSTRRSRSSTPHYETEKAARARAQPRTSRGCPPRSV